MKVTALAQWYGSNRILGHEVGEMLKGCSHVTIPFAGGMAEVAHIKARTLVVNDLHRHMINLAFVASDPKLGPKLIRNLRRVIFSPESLAKAQKYCKSMEEMEINPFSVLADESLFNWAKAYFTSAWMTRSGSAGTKNEFEATISIRWEAGGGDSVVRFRSATEALMDWRRILARATFLCQDAFDLLQFVQAKDRPETGIYCDPPFPGPGDKYKHKFKDNEKDHERLAEIIGQFRNTTIVCRYYDTPLIRSLYPEPKWAWKILKGRKQTNAEAPEVLIRLN